MIIDIFHTKYLLNEQKWKSIARLKKIVWNNLNIKKFGNNSWSFWKNLNKTIIQVGKNEKKVLPVKKDRHFSSEIFNLFKNLCHDKTVAT